MLANIRIVLVNTSHPGNIGSAARAMKTMGLEHLYLVQPKQFPHAKANELASSADDILDNAVVCDTIDAAILGCQLVIGTSARPREIPMPGLNPRECAEKIAVESQTGEIAIIFGRENSGLNNQEFQYCHYHLYIPTNPDYCSLNLAAAVQVMCYELRMAHQAEQELFLKPHDEYASADEAEFFYQHLEETLKDIEFINPENPKRHMQRLKRLFNRARLEKMEVNILRGILTAIQKNISKVMQP